jgi:ribosomal protein S27E
VATVKIKCPRCKGEKEVWVSAMWIECPLCDGEGVIEVGGE